MPYSAGYFDLVVSFGVLDYLPFFDDAIKDVFRMLRPSGVAMISLPNLSSWHNRLGLLLGYQPRDVEISKECVVGVHPHYLPGARPLGHIHTATATAFKELMEFHRFKTLAVKGARPMNAGQNRLASFLDAGFSKSPHFARRFIYVGQKCP